MTYPFVQSSVDLGVARGPRLAIAWHMAEGGGTVGYLSRPNPNGVSVHFVIERTGRIVQMLKLERMHTSIRTSAIRSTDDPPYDWQGADIRYGATAAVDVMAAWATTYASLGPNHASIGVEIEGFASNGPNAAQRASMALLFADMSATYPGIRSLGHRDFADYKACPGKLLQWDAVGGHGPEVSLRSFRYVLGPDGRLITGAITTPDLVGDKFLKLRDGTLSNLPGGWDRAATKVRLTEPIIAGKPLTDDWMLGYLIMAGAAPAEACFVLARNVTFIPYPAPPPPASATVTFAVGTNSYAGNVTLT